MNQFAPDEEIAFQEGAFRPRQDLRMAVDDPGFVQGTTVSERLRTFNGQLFAVSEHLSRLASSLSIVGIELPHSLDRVAEIGAKLVRHNHARLVERADLGLCILCSPVDSIPANGMGSAALTVFCYDLPFAQHAANYSDGQRLTVSSYRQVPAACWPAELKCRSRMHYYLADREAKQTDAASRALLLDLDGYVAEASTANIIAVLPGAGLVSPPLEKVLPGISLQTLESLANNLHLPLGYRDLTVSDLKAADEVMLCSTSPCLVPVSAIDGHLVGDGKPGPMFHRLMKAWSRSVDLDIVAQAERCSQT